MHVIKRKTVNPNPIDYRKPPPVQSCLPLRIKDVMRIEIDEKQSNSFRHFGSEFRLVTIFGRISRLAKKEKWSQRYGLYTVDDGSGEIVVHYNHLKKESKGNNNGIDGGCGRNSNCILSRRNLSGNS